ncbi:polysaccharide lyase family protein [Lactiplantibacillus modestisalitolerans]|uniref:rhamnogalacturonan endolyase n=1 Tax=Lactiplantibacillus modestisalitolerans TaxID=1457219 RepID=A0ABV5WSV9_9LACO|nr:polysaccharide lyase family protein [Lactiplantibacillus modestisalitolerans]
MLLKHEDGRYTFENRAMTLTLDQNGKAQYLAYHGRNLIEHLDGNVVDPDRHHSFYLDYHQDLKSRAPQFNRVEVVEDSATCKHLAFIDDQSQLGLAYHLVMRSEDAELAGYVVATSNSQHPFTINEMRTVYRLDPRLFPNSYTAARIGLQPSSNYTNQFKKWQDETYEMPNGERYSNSKVYSKYDYADFFADNPFWGFFGPEYGFWFVPGSTEYYPSGPLKQELMVHYDGILLNYLNGAHLGTGDFQIMPGWQKLYGPWHVYINDGPDKLADAKQYAQRQQAAWPAEWMQEDLYPLARGDVYGQLKLSSGEKIKLKVILSQGSTTFDKASGGYIYYGDTDEQGLFALKHVRPGKYTLSAYALEGALAGTFTSQVTVKAGDQTLPPITWNVPQRRVLWQIGPANHTTVPFQFSQALRNSTWRKLTPGHLVYEIGKSQPEQDWYSIQGERGTWDVQFGAVATDQPLTLVVALAGASKRVADHENDRGHGDPMLAVSLNGHPLGQRTFLDDNAVYRNALKCGSYHLWELKLPAGACRDGRNRLSFAVQGGYMMYDTILLTCSE